MGQSLRQLCLRLHIPERNSRHRILCTLTVSSAQGKRSLEMRSLRLKVQMTGFAGIEGREPCASSAGNRGASRSGKATVCPRDMAVKMVP